MVENAAAMGEYLRDELALLARAPDRSVRSGASGCSGASSSSEPRDPRAARPLQRGRRGSGADDADTKACLERGLYPFAHWNVFAITPPLNITRDELDEGLEVFDEVLAIADEYSNE